MKIVDCGGVKEKGGRTKHVTFQKNLNGERKKPKEKRDEMKKRMKGVVECVCMCECLCVCFIDFVGQICLDSNNVGTRFPCGDKMQVTI